MRRTQIIFLLIVFISAPGLVRADEFSALQQQLFLLIQQVTQLQSNLNTLQKISQLSCKTLERNLGLNESGDDVEFLQISLEKEGFSVGGERRNRVYGELTASAVTGFQQKYKSEILTPAGLQYGTGFAGKGTRAKLNSIYGCGAKAPDLSNRPVFFTPQAVSVSAPQPGQTVTSTVKVVGMINSDGWITPSGDSGLISLFDSTEKRLSQVTLAPRGDKKILPVSFDASLGASNPRTEYGFISFTSRSTSSLLATSTKEFRVPVKFSTVSNPSLQVLFPKAGQQLLSNNAYTFTWSGGSGKVSLLLISNGLEISGGEAVVWRVDNLNNTGSYTATLPPGLSGTYRLYVSDSGGRFGLSPFFFVSPGASVGAGQLPRITGVQGSQSLQTKETGTWTVGASDPEGGNLDFSVDWGDGTTGRPGVSGTGGIQTAIFSRSYAVNGTYTQIYRVTDPSGLSNQYANVVQVGSASAPTITSIVPSSGPIGTVVTITGTRFSSANNTISFGSGQLSGIPSTNGGKTIQFTVQQDQLGAYDVSVLSSSGRTNIVKFTVANPPTCSHLNNPGTNQLTGCFWKWRSTTVNPSSPDDGILAGEAVPPQPGFLPPVPNSATALDINWGENNPANSFTGTDYYSARWSGNLTFDPGLYRFTAGSDDDLRVFFDGVSYLDRWFPRIYTEDSFEVTFPVRTTVKIQVDFMERGVFARVKFGWTKL